MGYVELGLALTALAASVSIADDGASAILPAHVTALEGCWHGAGEVMGKPVSTSLVARSVTQGRHLVIETDSRALADATDAYSAHILIGSTAATSTRPAGLSSYFADSFGGDASAEGTGRDTANGFEVTYQYGDVAFVNQWSSDATALSWVIVMRGADATERAFARYELQPSACRG